MNNIEIINNHVASKFHYEFKFEFYGSDILKIVGSEDVLFSKEIEITFHEVFSITCNSFWKLDAKIKFLEQITDSPLGKEINSKYGVEVGFQVFKLNNEDNIDFFVVAESISWNWISESEAES